MLAGRRRIAKAARVRSCFLPLRYDGYPMKTTIASHSADEKKRLARIKSVMMAEIDQRLSQRGVYGKGGVPASFKQLFKEHLQDIFLQVYIWQSGAGREWEHALEVMDAIFWSLVPPASDSEYRDIVTGIPELVRLIRTLQAQSDIAPAKIDALLSAIEYHHKRLLCPSFYHANQDDGQGDAKTAPKDAELAKAILQMQAQLPDIADIDMDDLVIGHGEPRTKRKLSSDKGSAALISPEPSSAALAGFWRLMNRTVLRRADLDHRQRPSGLS